MDLKFGILLDLLMLDGGLKREEEEDED